MILSASKQLEAYRRTFSKLTALVRKHPDATLSEVIKVSFNEITGVTALELKEPDAQVTGDVPTVQTSVQEV
jgi:hypothetical protein